MAFVVEDGTGLADATSLVSVTYADEFFADRNRSAWVALSTQQKQGHLVEGTDYLTNRWNGLFLSQPLNDNQALPFPRKAFGLPTNVLKAVCEYAYQSAFGTLYNEMTTDASGIAVIKTKEKLGPMEETYAAVHGSSAIRTYRTFPRADALMRPYLASANGVYR